MTAAELVTRIEAFCQANRMAESTFGRFAVNDGKLVSRLRSGGSITIETLVKIEAALAKSPASLPEAAA